VNRHVDLRRTGIARSSPPVPLASRRAEDGRARGAIQRPQRPDTIPPSVRRLVNIRDPWCVKCGTPAGLHQHHRRLKGSGGDRRGHTDCPCNLVNLCSEHHEWAHGHRERAEAEGLIIPAGTVLPGAGSVLVATADGRLRKRPSCDGRWLDAHEAAEAS
jgi:hypothetical protein